MRSWSKTKCDQTHHNYNTLMRSRGYVFTLNNYTQDDLQHLERVSSGPKSARYLVYGKEVAPGTGTHHLQGFVYFSDKKSFIQVKRYLGSRYHIEKQKGSCTQAIDYCKKENEYKEFGDRPVDRKTAGKRSEDARKRRNLQLVDNSLNDLVREGVISLLSVPVLKKARLILEQESTSYEHSTVRGIWVYGPPGTGKSHWARTQFKDSLYIKAQNKWFDGYCGQTAILLDDFDSKVLGHYLKIWTDKWSCSGEIKNGTLNLTHHYFIITSNYRPIDFWHDDPMLCKAIERRCKMIEKNEVYCPTLEEASSDSENLQSVPSNP